MRGCTTQEPAQRLVARKLRAAKIDARLEEDGTVRAMTPQGHSLIIVSLLPQEGSPTRFVLPDVQESNRRFVVCTEADEDGVPVQWVFPEMCFAFRSPIWDAGEAELDLDVPGRDLCGQTIREGLPFLQERWDPIIQFDDFQEYMPGPDHQEFGDRWELMEDILELIWFRESRERPMDLLPIREIPDEERRHNVRISEQVSDAFGQMDEDEKANILDGIRSVLDDPFTADVLRIEGVRGSYRVVQLGQDRTAD